MNKLQRLLWAFLFGGGLGGFIGYMAAAGSRVEGAATGSLVFGVLIGTAVAFLPLALIGPAPSVPRVRAREQNRIEDEQWRIRISQKPSVQKPAQPPSAQPPASPEIRMRIRRNAILEILEVVQKTTPWNNDM